MNIECKQELRPDLESLPDRMRQLPIDERGYVVPWFVAWVGDKPEFRAMDSEKFVCAIRQKLCWVCGERLGVHLCFVAGPMCGINRTASEPPAHIECGRWSARNCPFLNNPRMVRREDEEINNQTVREGSAGFAIGRNPGVAMLWIARGYEVFRAPNGYEREKNTKYLITMGEPESVEWWASGRKATRAEVVTSIESGLPHLESVARLEAGAMAALQEAVRRFEKYLPKE